VMVPSPKKIFFVVKVSSPKNYILTPSIVNNFYVGSALIFGTEIMMIELHNELKDFDDLYAEEPITVREFK
jgi:hypothetical protein